MAESAIDISIVVSDVSEALVFYRDTLGLADEGEVVISEDLRIQRLRWGDSMVNLLVPSSSPAPAPSELLGSYGPRYWTMTMADDLAERVALCESRSYAIELQPTQIARGITIAMVRDREGNVVELRNVVRDTAV